MRSGKLKLKISKTLQKKIRQGYPWIRFHQIQNRNLQGEAGDLGVVYDTDNRFLAVGLYDPYSEIRLRILQAGKPVDIDRTFFEHRLREAFALRNGISSEDTTGYRLLNGENDGLPGLVMDHYGDTLVLKVYTAAWFPYLTILTSILDEIQPHTRILLRLSRHAEKNLTSGYFDGQVISGAALSGLVRFKENGLLFEADLLKGQKTGFFLDQRENRQELRSRVSGKSVLNVFSYTGGFSVYALAGGARRVTELEISRPALEASRHNLGLNFDKSVLDPDLFCQIQGDAFEILATLRREGEQFDVVILDPPAFAKNKKDKPKALQAYHRLVQAGAELVNPGGLLFAASCSAPVPAEAFYRAAELGLKASGRRFQITHKTRHPADHPVRFGEGAYLKALYAEISE